jgi:hypothetical protein
VTCVMVWSPTIRISGAEFCGGNREDTILNFQSGDSFTWKSIA